MKNNKKNFNLDDIDPLKCIYTIIGINVACHLLIGSPALFNTLALTTGAIKDLKLYQFVTYMFLHSRASMFHIMMNMWGLYLFGKLVAPRLGTKRFLQLYFFSGIFGGLLWTISNLAGSIPTVGASGAVFGVMMAAAMLEPNMRIMLLFPPIPMKLKTFAIVFGALEVFYTLSNSQPNVANLVHLGGLIGAYLFLKFYLKLPIWDVVEFVFGKKRKKSNSSYKAPKGWKVNNYKTDDPKQQNYSSSPSENTAQGEVPQIELDRILDKISEKGIKSLTAEEMADLKHARNKMKK